MSIHFAMANIISLNIIPMKTINIKNALSLLVLDPSGVLYRKFSSSRNESFFSFPKMDSPP